MLFESKAKAENFIAYNSEGIQEENGKAPVRSYYCELCGGYHVTSNPSTVAGEMLNQRDQKLVEQISNYMKGAEDYEQVHQAVSNRIDEAKSQMYLGHFEYIDELYESFQIAPDLLLKLPLKSRTKYVQLHQKVVILKEVAEQIKELLQLPREEIANRLDVEHPSKREKVAAKIVKGYLLIQDCNEGLITIHQLMEKEMFDEARDLLLSLRSQMPELKGEAIVKENLTKYQQELVKLEKEIADKKKAANKKKERVPKVETNETEEKPQRGEEYKTAILSVIERIEKVRQAFGQNDFDTCENELEIAEFLMDDLPFDDDNTKLLRSQIEMWKRNIAEGIE
jgi:hypothetical protein